jgi:hypothetical protein
MIHRQTFPKSRSLFDKIGIVARLGPEQGGLNQSRVQNAIGAPENLDQDLVYRSTSSSVR